MKFNLSIVIISVFLFSCKGKQEEKEVAEKVKKDTSIIEIKEEIPIIDSNALALNFENFQKVYVLNGGKGELFVDSLVSDTLILTQYKTISQSHQPNEPPYLWFEVYHFKTDSMTTEFFNDLKTRELVLPFGIDKRPKNIFLNGNIVIYHRMEHSYGHNYLKYIENFNSVIKLDRSAKNLDSLIGFTYCTCRHKKADFSLLIGNWKTKFISKISTKNLHSYNYFEDTTKFTNNLSFNIKITKDSLIMDQFKNAIENSSSSIEFPDSYYLMDYKFLKRNYNPSLNDTILKYSPEKFINEIKKIKSLKSKMIVYDLHLLNNYYPDIFYINSKLAYLSFQGYFYKMTRP